jgi:phosphatidylglycerophosphatase GEP4
MANRMNRKPSLLTMFYECAFESAGSPGKEKKGEQEKRDRGPLAIWTTGVWERESMAMRWCEKRLVRVVERWSTRGSADARMDASSRFVKEVLEPEPVREKGFLGRLWSSLSRS